MVNLLNDSPSTDELRRILEGCPSIPLLPALGDLRWKKLLNNPVMRLSLTTLLERAQGGVSQPLPELTDELYCDFARTGQRRPFEALYFKRRQMLGHAGFGLVYEPGNTGFRRSFLAKLEGIATEESWALPSTVNNPTGRDPMRLDLFSAETANMMGFCLNLFDEIIPTALQEQIRQRLQAQIFNNYLENAESMNWPRLTSNWNAVCHQGILGAALAVLDDTELLACLLKAASHYLPYFLKGYGEDGGCQEGPSYWEYGFGWFAMLNEQIEARTRGQLSLFSNDQKTWRIAEYGPAACLKNHYLVSFSDSSMQALVRPHLFSYLERRLNELTCRRQALESYRYLAENGIDLEGNHADLPNLLLQFYYAPNDLGAEVKSELKPDHYYPDMQVWIVRGRDQAGNVWELAAKCGHNEEHHNHNDVGSFLLNINGVPMLIDIGAQEYTRSYFPLDTRYQHFAPRTLSHSLPIVNRQEQAHGREYSGSVLESRINQDEITFALDFAGAYPESAACRSLKRRITLEKHHGFLVLEDSFAFHGHGTFESAFATDDAKISIQSQQQAIIEKQGLRMKLTCGPEVEWDRVESWPYRKRPGQELDSINLDKRIKRLVLVPIEPQQEIGYQIRLELLG